MRRRSLRLRLVLIFGLGTLLLSGLLGTLTYFGVRDVLITQQQQTGLQQSYVNAALIRNTSTPRHSPSPARSFPSSSRPTRLCCSTLMANGRPSTNRFPSSISPPQP